MRIRVVSWNVDSRPAGLLDAKVELLRRIRPDLALLQELSRSVYRALLPPPLAHERMHQQSRLFAWGALSTDLCRPRGDEHRLGCAVLGAPGTVVLGSQVLDRAPFGVSEPVRAGFLWRTVAARVALSDGAQLTVGSFQTRRASTVASDLQRAFHAGITGWASGVSGPLVVGLDAGAPAVDHPDARQVRPWLSASSAGPGGDDPLLGPHGGHRLYDVLRGYLDRRPEELARIRAERPAGPLAVSRRVAGQPVRYDHLFASPELEVVDVQYRYDDAAAAGSDHALIIAELET
ncbi:MAG TPA: hypothetical protein VLJ59_01815 [Mycobacteriales bacterium]|nr:hypothetical protein [Mycobacteriales bacterium]